VRQLSKAETSSRAYVLRSLRERMNALKNVRNDPLPWGIRFSKVWKLIFDRSEKLSTEISKSEFSVGLFSSTTAMTRPLDV
jgi:hypothetical protein